MNVHIGTPALCTLFYLIFKEVPSKFNNLETLLVAYTTQIRRERLCNFVWAHLNEIIEYILQDIDLCWCLT
jgi:hypothetical protein